MEHNLVEKRHGSFIYPPMGPKVDVELPWRGCTMLNRSERNLRYLSPLNYGFGDAVL